MRISEPKEDFSKAKAVIDYVFFHEKKWTRNISDFLYFLDMKYYEKFEEQFLGLKYFFVKNHMEIKTKKTINGSEYVLTSEDIKIIKDFLEEFLKIKNVASFLQNDIPVIVADMQKDKTIEYESVFYRKENV